MQKDFKTFIGKQGAREFQKISPYGQYNELKRLLRKRSKRRQQRGERKKFEKMLTIDENEDSEVDSALLMATQDVTELGMERSCRGESGVTHGDAGSAIKGKEKQRQKQPPRQQGPWQDEVSSALLMAT